MTDEAFMETDNTNESFNDASSTSDFPYIVDTFSLKEESNVQQSDVYYEIRTIDEQQTETGSEPILEKMSPLTIALMKRKSLHYMGLRPDRFSLVMEMAKKRTKLPELKLMLTLRKLRLKEDFETLGDLFDLDRKAAERYFDEAKYIVAELIKSTAAATLNVPAPTAIEMNQCPDFDPLMLPDNDLNDGVNGTEEIEQNSSRKRKFNCGFCEMKYSLQSLLDVHIRERHS